MNINITLRYVQPKTSPAHSRQRRRAAPIGVAPYALTPHGSGGGPGRRDQL